MTRTRRDPINYPTRNTMLTLVGLMIGHGGDGRTGGKGGVGVNAVEVLLAEHPTPWKIRRDRRFFTDEQSEEVIYDRNGVVVCTAPDYATAALIVNAVEVWDDA